MKKLKRILTRIKDSFDFNYYAIMYVQSANTILEATNHWFELNRGIQRGYIYVDAIQQRYMISRGMPYPMSIEVAKEHKKYIVNKYRVNPNDLSIIEI